VSADGYCKPNMIDSDEDETGIRLGKCRHRCVGLQKRTDFITNDINLAFPNVQLHMSGKSVYIRSVGAIVIRLFTIRKITFT